MDSWPSLFPSYFPQHSISGTTVTNKHHTHTHTHPQSVCNENGALTPASLPVLYIHIKVAPLKWLRTGHAFCSEQQRKQNTRVLQSYWTALAGSLMRSVILTMCIGSLRRARRPRGSVDKHLGSDNGSVTYVYDGACWSRRNYVRPKYSWMCFTESSPVTFFRV